MNHTVRSATPLVAIDAVVLDTETTGLDTGKARLLQIGAVRIRHGELRAGESLDLLVDPGEPIPPASTAIHHIDDTMVAGAPKFAEAWKQLSAFIGNAIVIGHSIGFDLAILRRECRLANIVWEAPRTLDTRLLAQIANPQLPDFSMEMVGSWLGVDLADRHTALGDAIATAKLYQALIPHLRSDEIRTIAAAEQACRKLSAVLDEHHRAGWLEGVAPASRADTERTLARIDSYPYRHRVRDVMSAPPAVLPATLPLYEAMKHVVERRISSAFVTERPEGDDAPLHAVETGIVTERDVLRAVAANGATALEQPLRAFMSKPLATIPADAFIYRAVGRMSRMKVRHLGVVDDNGDLVGALSARDLLRLRAQEAISLGDEIDDAVNVSALGAAWAKLPMVAESLVVENVDARDIAQVISREIGALTRKAAIIAEERMHEAGRGGPPVPYALLILGSGGRGESLMAADQDNAIVFESGDPDGPEDQWFAELGEHIAEILDAVHLPLCKGGVMAKNPQWRGSLATWLERVEHWIRRSNPKDLLNVDIFFDLRVVHGDIKLGQKLLTESYTMGHHAPDFAKLLAALGDEYQVPVSFFGGFKSENGRVDLKKGGLFPIVQSARVLAIRHNIVHRATKDRLEGVRALGIGGEADLTHMLETHGFLLDLILRQQVEDLHDGHPLGNSVRIKQLDRSQSERLREALSKLSHASDMVKDLLFSR
ncbi:MAG: CBS domain-containing protein [Hyphomicrobiales bacterium]|nr:CBS domain-containing protein [Hyphomicrobiales bacterium]